MTACVHHTPGRLRLRSSLLKNSPVRARDLEAHLKQCSGIASVHVNTLTGSVLVCFEITGTTAETVLTELTEQGYSGQLGTQRHLPNLVQADGLLVSTGKYIARSTCKVASERLLQYMIGSALASLL